MTCYLPVGIQQVLCAELRELLEYQLDESGAAPLALTLPFVCPPELHAAYTRDEILAALGHWTLQRQPAMREGVLHLPALKADVFMVTLNKTDKDYSPTTMYQDYAISETLFHWQSQSTTSEDSPTGMRYREHQGRGHTILLCVRENNGGSGPSQPYYFLGPVDYVKHSGSKPMSITWRMRYPIPAALLRRTAVAAAA